MGVFFRGRFDSKLDPKGRLSIPAGLRQNLQQTKTSLVITNSQHRGHKCLDVYSLEAWEQLEERIQKMPQLKFEVQSFQRFYLSGAQVVAPDTQNRVLIPQGLRQYANITTETVLVGMGNKLEIWDEKTWSKLFNSFSENFDDTLAAVAQLEVEL